MSNLAPQPLTDIGLKRLITEAGRISDQIKPLADQLAPLNERIKFEMRKRVERPGDSLTIVSGEYVATLTAEKKERPVNLAAKLILFSELGKDKFFELCALPMETLKKALDKDRLNELLPEKYSGKGRAYSLTKKS